MLEDADGLEVGKVYCSHGRVSTLHFTELKHLATPLCLQTKKERLPPKKRKCFYFDKNVNFLSAAVAVISLVTGVSAGEGWAGRGRDRGLGPGMIMKSGLGLLYNQKRLCKKDKLSDV